MQILKYKLNSLACPMCAVAVQHTVAALPGVAKATADFPTQTLVVEGIRLNSKDIITAVRESGSDIDAEEEMGDAEPPPDCSSEVFSEDPDERNSSGGEAAAFYEAARPAPDDLCGSGCVCRFKKSVVPDAVVHVYDCPEYIKDAEKRFAAPVGPKSGKISFWRGEQGKEALLLILSATMFCAAMVLDHVYPEALDPAAGGISGKTLLVWTLFIVPYLICGVPVFRGAIRALQNKSIFNEFSLMAIATLAAIGLNQLPEAVGVMLFYCVGEFFQELAVSRSRSSIKALMASRPVTARVVGTDGAVRVRAVESVLPGEDVIVRPGEKIPLDGFLISGRSQLDTSPLTGEPKPMRVEPGREIRAGYINLDSVLTFRVTQTFKDSEISRILELTEKAALRKAAPERFVTRFARVYTPIVVLLAVLVACLPPLLGGAEWREWIYRSLVLLVISCPCALVISIPLSYFGGIGGASRRGILVKGGLVLDSLKKIDTVVFDKTGTLTEGVFAVNSVSSEPGVSRPQVLQAAGIAEMQSNHPVARSIMSEIGTFELPGDLSAEELPGLGMRAESGGHVYLAGNGKLMEKMGVEFRKNPAIEGTVVYVAENGRFLGSILVSDRLREDAAKAVSELKKRGLRIYMLTGDRMEGAVWVAKATGIDDFKAGLLPSQKVEALEEITKPAGPGHAAFVGDGVNDAPIISLAGIGIAVGGASEVAIEASDVVLQGNSPGKVVQLFDLARKVRSIVWQNIALALGVKITFMCLGVVGISGLWEAVFADVGVALMAVLNASRATRV